MTTFGLGRTAWGLVAAIAVMNLYAILPTVGDIMALPYAVGLVAGSYLWIRFLKAVYVRLPGFGTAEAAA